MPAPSHQIVTTPADFKWKPKREIATKEEYPLALKENGIGVTKSLLMSSSAIMEWELDFETSAETFQDILQFLRSKKMGHVPFTWYCHEDATTYTVRLIGGLKRKKVSDNTTSQKSINHQFSLVFRKDF